MELVRFFNGLKKHNTKEWFQDHKQDYETHVKQPSQEFVMAMGDKLKAIAPKIHAIPKVNQSLFRLNRDTRFSKDKSPYKTNLGIWFWEGDRKRMECSGKVIERGWNALVSISIWIQITLCWAPAYTSLHIFPKELLGPYRDAVVDKKHGLELQKAVNKVSKLGYTIVGKHYKRIPSGYDDTHKNSQFLLYNGLAAMHQNEISEGLLSDRIVDYAFSHFKKMSPIHKWLRAALG
jgi:uncharacterized protein (TIGR02453 family)